MADFEAILKKALASRPDASGEERRKVYERARQALIKQLEGFEPPLPPEEISKQRLALESSIRRIEADAAAGALRAGTAAPASPIASVAPQPAPAEPAPEPPAPAQPSAPKPVIVEPPAAAAPVETAEPHAEDTPRMPEAQGIAPISTAPEPPLLGEQNSEPVVQSAQTSAVGAPDLPDPSALDAPPGAAADAERVLVAPPPEPPKRGMPFGVIIGLLLLIGAAGGGVWAWQTGLIDFGPDDSAEAVAEQPADGADEPLEQVRSVDGGDERASERLLPDNQGVEDTGEPIELDPAAAERDEAGETDVAAVPEEPAEAPVTDVSPVAQTAILYEEGLTADDPAVSVSGQTEWRLDGSGRDAAIVVDVDLPERGLAFTMRIMRNNDATLPATHLLEFNFSTGAAFPAEGGVRQLVGVILKAEERARGEALRGALAELSDGIFWLALSADEADATANLALLAGESWFDLPILYADERRAIVSFEKGVAGEQVFEQAFAAWES